jgi:hypothetical protein
MLPSYHTSKSLSVIHEDVQIRRESSCKMKEAIHVYLEPTLTTCGLLPQRPLSVTVCSCLFKGQRLILPGYSYNGNCVSVL